MTELHDKYVPIPDGDVRDVSASGQWPSLLTEPGTRGLRVVTLARSSQTEVETPTLFRPDPYLGFTIDARYKVEAVLGEGGMGVVYRCSHTIIGKKVAMKVLRADLARDAEVTERFLNEAKAASAIGNSHIIDISDFGQFPDGSTYFVMEYLVGQPLSAVVDGGKPLPVARLIHIARQLTEGLAAAHAASIVHRDLKPDNIFLVERGGEKDFVKILDFGIAKVSNAGEASKLTRAGAVFGTPHYMSPEQAAGQPVDHRGDIYALGVILYELASGRVPFDADNFMGILTQHMYKSPVPIRALVPQRQDVPPGLEAIVLKCLSKRPEHRYQTMNELGEELDRLRAGVTPLAVPELMARSGSFNIPSDYAPRKYLMPARLPATPLGVPMRSRGPLLLVGALAALAGIALTLTLTLPRKPAPPSSELGISASTESETPKPASTTAPATQDPPVGRQVVLGIEPIEAHVFHGARDLGTGPVVIEVPRETAVQLEIRCKGYKDARVVLDGSSPRQSVKLEKLAPASAGSGPSRAKPSERTKRRTRPSIGSGEIVNPWR